MGKIPISYKAYDNEFRIPMRISLSIGLTLISMSFAFESLPVLIVGIVFVVLFFVFKILNYYFARIEAKEMVEERMNYELEEFKRIMDDDDITMSVKLDKISKLAEEGNAVARLFLSKLCEEMERNNQI